MTRRAAVRSIALTAALALGVLLAAPTALAQQKVLKFIPQADLRILDPITTTAYITRNHGYMVYDTLFATDAKFQVQPQMVDKYELSSDKLTYTFTLRDGLKFHDGAAVRSADCIASIERWAKRDALGQKLAEATEGWTAASDSVLAATLPSSNSHAGGRQVALAVTGPPSRVTVWLLAAAMLAALGELVLRRGSNATG